MEHELTRVLRNIQTMAEADDLVSDLIAALQDRVDGSNGRLESMPESPLHKGDGGVRTAAAGDHRPSRSHPTSERSERSDARGRGEWRAL